MVPAFAIGLALFFSAGCLLAAIAMMRIYRNQAATLSKQVELQTARDSINDLLQPLKDSIAFYNTRLSQMENQRHSRDGQFSEQLSQLMALNQNLQRETVNLVHALKQPQVRGSWGEVQLRRVVELAGMSEYCDFTLQESVTTEEGRLRPDLVVRLPNNRTIVVDAKAVFHAYLEAVEAKSDTERHHCLERHARHIREQVNLLSSKRYSDLFENSPDFVVCFLHIEAFLYAACETDKELVEYAMKKNVVLATPMTLIALLKAIAFGWRQAEIAQNSRLIGEQATELIERLGTALDHLQAHGKHLALGIDSYNKLLGSVEHKLIPQAERMLNLGIVPKKPIPELTPVEILPRDYHNDRLTLVPPPAPRV